MGGGAINPTLGQGVGKNHLGQVRVKVVVI